MEAMARDDKGIRRIIQQVDPPADWDGDLPPLSQEEVAGRLRKRRIICATQTASYAFDSGIVILFAAIGAAPASLAWIYLFCGVVINALAWGLSETRFTDRLKDHYLTVPWSMASTASKLLAIYLAPSIGFYFVALIFVVLSFGALRSTGRQAALVCGFAVAGLGLLMLGLDVHIALPMDSAIERAISLFCLFSALARYTATGLYGGELRRMLFERGRDLAEASRRIAEMAQMDELTGALNRRTVMTGLEEEIARANRGIASSVALIDLDFFKFINDRFGHPVGDEVLRAFAANILANIRSVDSFGRYGGEEFLLVMPGLDPRRAARMLDGLRRIIAGVDWAAIAPGLKLTMSAGVCGVTGEGTIDVVLARADAALYRAKDEGRNRVVGDSLTADPMAPPLQPEWPAVSLVCEASAEADIQAAVRLS